MTTLRRILSRVGLLLDRLVADRKTTTTPGASYIPNSNGEGGTVVSTGQGSAR